MQYVLFLIPLASLKDHTNLRDYCLGKVLWHPKFHVLFLRFSVSAVLLAPAMENCYIRFLQNIYSHSLIYHYTTLVHAMCTLEVIIPNVYKSAFGIHWTESVTIVSGDSYPIGIYLLFSDDTLGTIIYGSSGCLIC